MKNRLKVLRAERDWSQADLAERLEVSRQTVNAIETEKYDPSLPLAFRIARLFGQPLESIFEPNGNRELKPQSSKLKGTGSELSSLSSEL
jgi:putative transcriptional regulator